MDNPGMKENSPRESPRDSPRGPSRNPSQEFHPPPQHYYPPPHGYGPPPHGGYPGPYYGPPHGYPMPPPPQQMPMHQMSTSNTTTVVVNQPQASTKSSLLVTSLHGQREWSSGLFGCFDDAESCLCTWFCPICMEMKNYRRAGEFCCIPCFCPAFSLIALRTKVRGMGDIKGSICNDYCAVTYCYMCVLCQISRELDAMDLQ